MLSWFRARSANARKAKELYGAVVAMARHPQFYRDYGIPDTLNGRYEMIVLTLFQLLERLRVEGADAEELSRLTLEAFFTDMDDSMREIGVGDLSVSKKVKKAAAGFYERARAYRAALDQDDSAALTGALDRFIREPHGEAPDTASAGTPPGNFADMSDGKIFARLARHMLAQRDHLAAADRNNVVSGRALLSPE